MIPGNYKVVEWKLVPFSRALLWLRHRFEIVSEVNLLDNRTNNYLS